MGKLTFIAGMAAGYVLGARAGRRRYEQIRRTSGKVWNSGPVQKQVYNAKEVARTKAAPVVADMVADAARATGEKLRSSRTVEAEAIARLVGEVGIDMTAGPTAIRTALRSLVRRAMMSPVRLLVLSSVLCAGCHTAERVAVSSFRVIDAPAKYIRDRIDPTESTTTTTTTGSGSSVWITWG